MNILLIGTTSGRPGSQPQECLQAAGERWKRGSLNSIITTPVLHGTCIMIMRAITFYRDARAVSVDQCTASYAFLYISAELCLSRCVARLCLFGEHGHQPAKAGLCFLAW